MDKLLLNLTVFLGLLFFVYACPTPFSNCPNIPPPSSVCLNNCAAQPCTLQSGTTATLVVVFVAPRDIKALTPKLKATIGIITIDYDVPEPDGCKSIDVTCPIAKGTTVTYTTSAEIPSIFKGSVTFRATLYDENNVPIVCGILQAKIN